MPTHPRDPRTETAMQVLRGWERFQWGWPRFLLAWSAGFQLAVALTLAFAPHDQLLTPGTRPVLEMASRYVWAGLYLASAVLTASAPRMGAVWRGAAWVAVMGLGGLWLTAFAVNVLTGRGSALGVVAWLFLYVPLVAVALHMSLGKR